MIEQLPVRRTRARVAAPALPAPTWRRWCLSSGLSVRVPECLRGLGMRGVHLDWSCKVTQCFVE